MKPITAAQVLSKSAFGRAIITEGEALLSAQFRREYWADKAEAELIRLGRKYCRTGMSLSVKKDAERARITPIPYATPEEDTWATFCEAVEAGRI